MRLIIAREAADLLAIRLPRLYELARLNVIPHVRLGPRQIRFDPDLLKKFAEAGGIVVPKNERRQDEGEQWP